MHVELANLDTEGLSLQLPSTGDVAREVRIAATKNLRGVLTQTDGVLEISDARAKSVLLDALRLLFGSVLLEARGQTRLGEVRTDVRREQAATELRLEVESLATPMLRIEVGSVLVAGNTAFRGGKLEVHGSEGAFEASSVHVGAFYLGLGSVGVTAPELRAERLTVSWGKEGFRLDAEVVDSPSPGFPYPGP